MIATSVQLALHGFRRIDLHAVQIVHAGGGRWLVGKLAEERISQGVGWIRADQEDALVDGGMVPLQRGERRHAADPSREGVHLALVLYQRRQLHRVATEQRLLV